MTPTKKLAWTKIDDCAPMDVNDNLKDDNDTSNSPKGDFMKVVYLFDKLTTKEISPDKLINSPELDRMKLELSSLKYCFKLSF